VIESLARQIFAARSSVAEPLRLWVQGTQFQVRVWRALLKLDGGQTTSYGQLARDISAAGSARAVGNAVGANPIAWLIPCHQVLRANGALGGYRWGTARKRAMLAYDSLRRARRHRVHNPEAATAPHTTSSTTNGMIWPIQAANAAIAEPIRFNSK